ncbi:anti-sigma factor [Paenibacillus tarimensis]|uniref:anti-sigma factor n=1 Tax=Paenibacillus tarimensis TaxID=416012 RepID=UPI001F31C9AD|nr:anti-sigma factor [Paenibacillus tarimensis]
MFRCLRYTEEQWVDRIRGSISAEERFLMDTHAETCEECHGIRDEWHRLLAPGEIEPLDDNEVLPLLPSSYERSLFRTVRGMRPNRSAVRGGWLAAAACILVMLLIGGLSKLEGEAEPLGAYVSRQVPEAEAVMLAPDSSRYRALTIGSGEGEGYVWVSRDSQEVLLMLDGLPAHGQIDYQAWAVSGDRHDSLGVLSWSGSRAHLHVRSPLLQKSDNISISVEPLGGSVQPTGRETFLVLLQKD